MIKSTHTHKKTLNLLKKRPDYSLLRRISCPLLLAQSVKPDRYQRVLATVAIDDGDDEKPRGEQSISSHFGIEPAKFHLASGSTYQVIVEMATQIDAQLVVTGTIVRAGISGAILDNVCDKVLDQLSIDILTVH